MSCRHCESPLPLDKSLDSVHAVLRVLCRLEIAYFDVSLQRERSMADWYSNGFHAIRAHLKTVTWERVA